MKIVWRTPNSIDRTSFLMVKTLAVEQPDELRVFYCSSRGPWAFGTIFELLVNRGARSLGQHDALSTIRFFFNAHTFATECGQIFHAFAGQEGQQEGSPSRCKGKGVVREDVCFADMEVAVESSPVPA